jgi:hypothetical protein
MRRFLVCLGGISMTRKEVLENLCYHDKRNPNGYEYDQTPRDKCYCDNCFYGRDRLALEILELMNDGGFW